jgi:integrase
MATIESYGTQDGRRYAVRYRKPNRRQTMKRGFRTKRDAERFASEVEVSKDRGQYIDPRDARVTIGELGPGWLSRQTHLKPSSYRPLEIAWRVHVEPAWASHRLGDVAHTEIQNWVSEMGKTRGATTVQRALAVLSGILEEAVRDRRILSSPCKGVKTPRKVKKPHTYLTHAQVHALAHEAGPLSAAVLVMAYCGLRWGEMAALRVMDVDLPRRRLSIEQNAVEVGHKFVVGTPKSHERRTVPFPELLEAGLKKACDNKLPSALVFPAPDGDFMHNNTRGWFAGAVKRSGTPRITPHGLRHTAASLAISAGANVKAVQRMLGHASAAMTLDTYADLFDDDLDDVATALHRAAMPFIAS